MIDPGPRDLEPVPTHVEQRKSALRALLVITPLGGAVFLVLNLRLEAPVLSVLAALLVLGSLGLLLALYQGRSVKRIALVYLLLLYANILVALARPDVHPGAANSMTMLPVLAYLLLQVRIALPVTVLALAAATLAYLAGVGVAPYRLEPLVIAHIGSPTLALFVVCHFYSRNRARSSRQLLDRVLRDPLTGLWNREKLDAEFEREVARSRRTASPLTLLLLDLDQFKALNDRLGHQAGDAALVHFAELVAGRVREIDLVCRIGGEEFIAVLPDTGATGAMKVAEDLRHAVAENPVRYGHERIHLTVSIGIAEFGPDGTDWPSLYRAADGRLYEAKAGGRNRVVGCPLPDPGTNQCGREQ